MTLNVAIKALTPAAVSIKILDKKSDLHEQNITNLKTVRQQYYDIIWFHLDTIIAKSLIWKKKLLKIIIK